MICRTDYLTLDSNYHCYFTPFVHLRPMENVFQEIFIAPFVHGQIERYIIQYLSVKRFDLLSDILLRPELSKQWLFPKTYEYWIENIHRLKDLSCQPFLLRITMEVLPEVIVEMQASPNKQDNFKMTSAKLYDYFFCQWFARQKNKLSSKLIGLGEFVSPTF